MFWSAGQRSQSNPRSDGKEGGALVKLRECGFRTALPSIHLANLRSLPNKTDELLLLTRTNKDLSNAAALCFSETWLSEGIPDNTLHLPGYQLFRADRITELMGKNRGGGLCSDVTTLKKMCSPNLEALFINRSTLPESFPLSFWWMCTSLQMRAWAPPCNSWPNTYLKHRLSFNHSWRF